MIIPDDVVCKTCDKVFCCAECRKKHELKTHAIAVLCVEPVLHLFCPICQKQPFILQEAIHTELLVHITNNHLPLNCQKCLRIYTKVQDLMEFTKCTQHVPCTLELSNIISSQNDGDSSTPPQKSHATSISTQTSPIYVPQINDSHLTPISMINLRWKTKSKAQGEFISDSVSSIKNISSIDGSIQRKSIGIGLPITRGKLVRSTSTPLQADFFSKPKEQVFNLSGAHVSSIYNSVSEPESSPPLVPPIGNTPSGAGDRVNRYQKVRRRGKISAAVTPLRHVMSKSIQKAIAEHGIATGSRAVGVNPKKMFDSVDSSNDISERGPDYVPLDLRLSPALRRTQSEIIDRKNLPESLNILQTKENVHSATRKQTESIIITSKIDTESEILTKGTQLKSSVYQTRRSVQIITSTSTELNQININEKDVVISTSTELKESNFTEEDVVIAQEVNQSKNANIVAITPRIPISAEQITKKIINFGTPVVYRRISEDREYSDEQFYTPNSSPVRNTGSKNVINCAESVSKQFYSVEEQDDSNKVESIGSDYTDVIFDNEDFNDKTQQQNKSRLWSLVSSVMRFPTLNKVAENKNSSSLIKRCASFAGSLVNKSSDSHDPSVKRKRTYTMDSQSFDYSTDNNNDWDVTCSESKRVRIQPRRPIDRMRSNN